MRGNKTVGGTNRVENVVIVIIIGSTCRSAISGVINTGVEVVVIAQRSISGELGNTIRVVQVYWRCRKLSQIHDGLM